MKNGQHFAVYGDENLITVTAKIIASGERDCPFSAW